MSIWTRISEVVAAIVAKGEALLSMFERRPAAPECSVAFTMAIICLAAKMAKADGRVNVSEVTAFRQVFQIDPRDEAAAARVFNLARQDTAGFETYARQIARMFADRPRILEDLLEGLFHIAVADDSYHEEEAGFLARVAHIFGISDETFACVEARLTSSDARDPWKVLGVGRDAAMPEIRARWRELVRAHHPDKMIARGLPVETVNLANARLAAINRAWDEISHRTRQLQPAE